MQIRTRLTLQFLLFGGAIFIIASAAIYFLSERYLREDFFSRLESRARNTAKLLIEVEEINADLLKRIEKDSPANLPDEKTIILNYEKDTLYTSDESGEIKITDDVLQRLYRLGKITYIQEPYRVVGLLYAESANRFAVISAATDNAGVLRLRNLRLILISVCLSSLLVLFLVGWIYSGRALKPISDVVRRVEEITITSLNLRLDEGNGADELARLAKTFNNMLSRLEKSFAVQKDFIANASHELRTPLTSIYGQIEVLLMKDRSTEEYKKELVSVLDDIKSLSDLANRLLLMARTASPDPSTLNNKVRLDEILWQVQEDMGKFKKDYHVNIKIDEEIGESEQMQVAGDESLLRTAIMNLADNACKYSGNKEVNISLFVEKGFVKLVISDKGIGIPDDELNKIKEPFFRGSNAKSVPGHGIGLALVNQIVLSHKGRMEINSRAGSGTDITLFFPVSA
ncbi:MAG TPA: HAMP domain-containing sensor histidine kinase [Bacteroidales bacterium]|nr:HAMP domain-containing sensor histidine kinase [Bacteroidales bacterium]